MAASLLSRFRRRSAGATPAPAAPLRPVPSRRPLPPASQLRRERRALLRMRERRLRDLGGLVLEMIRRDQFREDLVYEQSTELLALDDRVRELDALLATATAVRRTRPAARCECGAPILWGSRFCASCGRPLGDTPTPAEPGAAEAQAEPPAAEAEVDAEQAS